MLRFFLKAFLLSKYKAKHKKTEWKSALISSFQPMMAVVILGIRPWSLTDGAAYLMETSGAKDRLSRILMDIPGGYSSLCLVLATCSHKMMG